MFLMEGGDIFTLLTGGIVATFSVYSCVGYFINYAENSATLFFSS